MVVVDKLTNDTHFIMLKTNHKVANIIEIYMKEISRLHGVPKAIELEKYPKFTSNVWKGCLRDLGLI
jgi:hypothetical protein